jgi:hypothetical protein
MACFEHGTIIDLASRETVRLPDIRGATLRVTRGTAWITQQNDTQDVVLRAGDTWVVEHDGLTLLEAQSAATVCIVGRRLSAPVARAAQDRGASWWRNAWSVVARVAAGPQRSPVPYY